MKLNITTQSIASAEGWGARYGNTRRALLCWALTDDGLVGLIQGAGADARNAEQELVDGQQFTDYVHASQVR